MASNSGYVAPPDLDSDYEYCYSDEELYEGAGALRFYDWDDNCGSKSAPTRILTIEEQIEQTIRHGELSTLRTLIEENPTVDLNRHLLMACELNQPQFVEFLISSGADPSYTNSEGATALMYACYSYQTSADLIKYLIDVGSPLHARDENGRTALMVACKFTNKDSVAALVEGGANPFETDNYGYTPIFYAVTQNRPENVKYLLDVGVSKNIVCNRHQTPLQLAKDNDFQEIIELLDDWSKSSDYLIPPHYTYTSDISDMAPSCFPYKTDKPAYFTYVGRMLNGMGLDHRLDILAVNKINLMEFLAMTDERLKTIGFEFKFERKRILQCLHRFHVHGWSKDSIKKPQKNSADDLYDLFIQLASHLQHMLIMDASIQFVKTNYGDQITESDATKIEAKKIIDCIADIRGITKNIKKEVVLIQKCRQGMTPIQFNAHKCKKSPTLITYAIFLFGCIVKLNQLL